MKSSAREFTLTLTRVEMPRVGGDGHRLTTWIRRENGARRRGWWRCCRCGRRSFGSFLGLLFRHWLRWLLQQKIKLNSKVNRNRVLLATNIGNLKPVIKCLSTPIWLAVFLINWLMLECLGRGWREWRRRLRGSELWLRIFRLKLQFASVTSASEQTLFSLPSDGIILQSGGGHYIGNMFTRSLSAYRSPEQLFIL